MKLERVGLLFTAAFLAGTIACASGERGREGDHESDRSAKKHAVTPEVLAKGQQLYKTTCAPCHGDGGKGDGPAGKIFKPPPRDHTDATYMDTISDEEMGKTIQMGGALKGKPSMPSNPQIRGDDLKALIAHVRSLSRHGQ